MRFYPTRPFGALFVLNIVRDIPHCGIQNCRPRLFPPITSHIIELLPLTRLKRDRSTITRDVAILNKAGLVTVEQKVLPGHGRMKEVKTTAHRLKLEALL